MNVQKLKAKFQSLTAAQLWRIMQQCITIFVGSALAALGYALFQLPFNLAAGGVSGLSIIINHFTAWPEGSLILLMNIPLLILGFYVLGRWEFLFYTVLSVLVFSVATDLFTIYLPKLLADYPITKNMLLSAIYAGLVVGIGNGIVYSAGGTLGGTGIIGRIVQQKTGLPLSQAFLYSDGMIIFLGGIVFGWESALHALLSLFLAGLATDFALEGPSMVRTVTIISTCPTELAQALMDGLNRGITYWNVTGGYSGQTHALLMCTVYRSQVNALKQIVATVDPEAFMVIGTAHQALGAGFLPLKKQ